MGKNIFLERKILEWLRGEIVICKGFQDYLLKSSDLQTWRVYNTEFRPLDIEKIVIEKKGIHIYLEKDIQ